MYTEGVPKRIKFDNGGAFISSEYKKFIRSQNIDRAYGTANLHTCTGLVERMIQILKKILRAILEDGLNLLERRALYILIFTLHCETKKTPFETHFGRAPRANLSNQKTAISVDSECLSVYVTRNPAGEITNHLVMSEKRP